MRFEMCVCLIALRLPGVGSFGSQAGLIAVTQSDYPKSICNRCVNKRLTACFVGLLFMNFSCVHV